MSLLQGLDEIGDGDGSRFGGKAVALAALGRMGNSIPRTLCLSTEAYDLFVDGTGLRGVLYQELGRKRFEDMRWEEIWDTALRIRNRFLRATVPDEIGAAVRERISSNFSDCALAIRSSAPEEDTESASFAGLHDSYVGVRGTENVLVAIRKVWASLWTDRALLYRQELGMDARRSAMAVVIQELIEGKASGVAFGVHPSEPDLAVIEAVYGLNQGLVDGTVEPDRWILERSTGRVLGHTPPERRRRMVARGEQTSIEDVPSDEASRMPLDQSDLSSVFESVRRAEAQFGRPQDVEWTMADGRLVLLQSRPVTTSTSTEGDQRAWYVSLTRSLENLRDLRSRVEEDLLPAMDAEADEIARRSLSELDDRRLAEEIDRRRQAHDRWVDVYWREFIPLAHGIRIFGRFYNEVVLPEDPYEFMELLAGTELLSVRRNRELASLAARVRSNPALQARLEAYPTDDGIEKKPSGSAEPTREYQDLHRAIEAFEDEFGGSVYGDKPCFGDRRQLVRLILTWARAPLTEGSPPTSSESRTRRFLELVEEDRQELARELLDLGRVAYRLRDDDNLHLARLEALVLEAVEDGRRRVGQRHGSDFSWTRAEDVLRALRHPNLVIEPLPAEAPPRVDQGFRARPRQLVGQPAGPGFAVGPARVISRVEDLYDFQPGEVLVCDAVDPNMTFVAPLAGAVVERRGGMLVHGAIIAREYGLPCVTGIPQANSLISTGDRLTVDGYLGIVTVS